MYIIVEIQTLEGGALGVLTTTADSWRQAQKLYHEKLMYAAQSTIPCYAVCLMDQVGNVQEKQYYTTQPEAEA